MKRFVLTLSQVGVFLLTAFGGFYERIAPPQDDLRFWTGFASLVGGIIFIIVTIAVGSEKVRSIILSISIGPALVFPVLYYTQYQSRTSDYGSSRVICGTVYTSKGAAYTSAHREETRQQIIEDFAGQTAEIWTEDSIHRSQLILGLFYSLAFGFLAFTVLAALQLAKKANHGQIQSA